MTAGKNAGHHRQHGRDMERTTRTYLRYYYDEETGMYYLKSRYYQPEICRFISADDISIMLDNPMSLWDKNLYVYGDNDTVNKKDDDGEIAQFVAMGIIGSN